MCTAQNRDRDIGRPIGHNVGAKIFGFDPREIIFLVSLDDKYTKKQKSRGKKFLCFHKIFVPNMITAG